MPEERPGSTADDLLARLAGSPDAYPQKIELVRELILLVHFDAGAYRAASFLDDRILTPTTSGAWLTTSRVAEAVRFIRDPQPVHFIFHTGHVGSTLVSRLLDETGLVLPLREPLPLRTLAETHDILGRPESLLSERQFDATLAMFMQLWGRGYPESRMTIVKATSSAGRLAAPILQRHAGGRAIYLNLRAEPYLATLLAGQNSPADLRGHGPERMRRLQSRLALPLIPLHEMSIGELAALGWLAESSSQHDATQAFPDRVLTLDFEQFLSNIVGTMGSVLSHFGLPVDARYLSLVERSAVLTRYSKAPEHAYTPRDRAEILADSRRHNNAEIRKGMSWLERLANTEAAVAAVVNSVGV
jgi:hypothetical protein